MSQPSNPFWNKNSEILKKRFPKLYKKIISKPIDTSPLRVLQTPDNYPVLTFQTPQASLDFYSQQTMKITSEQIIKTIPKNSKTFLSIGMAPIFHFFFIRENFPNLPFHIIEPHIGLFLVFLHLSDLTPLLMDRQIHWWIGEKAEDAFFKHFLRIYNLDTSGNLTIPLFPSAALYQDPFSRCLCPKEHQSFLSRWNFYLQQAAATSATIRKFDSLWICNILQNAPRFLDSRPVLQLGGIAEKKPAVLAAAGPSLDHAIPFLKKNRKFFYLIAVDSALPSLAAKGLQADIAMAVDPTFENLRHIQTANILCESGKKIATFSLLNPAVNPKTFSIMPPGFLCCYGHPLTNLIEQWTRKMGIVILSGSVATAAMAVLALMKCSPIFCAGLDLGFISHRIYSRGCAKFLDAINQTGRFSTLPMFEKQFLSQRNDLIQIPQNETNNTLLTTEEMRGWGLWLEKTIERKKMNCYRLGDQGLNVKGIKSISFSEAEKILSSQKSVTPLSFPQKIKKTEVIKSRLENALNGLLEGFQAWENKPNKPMPPSLEAIFHWSLMINRTQIVPIEWNKKEIQKMKNSLLSALNELIKIEKNA